MHTYEKESYRLLLNAQELCRYVYTGEFMYKPEKFGSSFVRQCLLVLIKTKAYQGHMKELFIPEECLIEIGDNSFWLTQIQLGEFNDNWFERTKPNREGCMLINQFKCIICSELHGVQSNIPKL